MGDWVSRGSAMSQLGFGVRWHRALALLFVLGTLMLSAPLSSQAPAGW